MKTWTYDERGNLVSLSEDDKSIEYSYDKWHRLTESRDGTEISVDNGEPQEVYQTYSYTDNSYLPERHRLVQGEAAVISTLYEYRDDNRLQKVIEDGLTAAEYEYDANGNNTKITYGNGIVTERTFTPGNQIKTQVIRNGSEILYSETNSYRLDGNLSSRTYTMDGKTTVDTYDYDEAGMLSGESRTQAGSEQYDYTFAYDNRGNRTSFAESVSGEVTTYEYDLNNRLVNAEKAFISQNPYKETTSYYYDPNGNTVTSVMETSDTYHSFTDNYHIAEITDSFGSAWDGYEFTRYEYDVFGRLTYYKSGSHEAEYTYNPDDLRSTKTVDGRTNEYVWDGDEIAAEFDYSNYTVMLQKYIYGLDRVLMEGPGSVNVYYQQNSHGDTVTLTGTVNGNVYGTYEYDAFGNATDGGADYMVLESGHMLWSATRNNQFRYCGEYFDQETDSYYLRARYYDPALGRFISEDTHWNTDNMIYGDNPVKINERENPYNPNNSVTFAYSPNINAVLQSGNLYAYCMSNSVMYSDSTGNFAISISAAAASAIGYFCAAGISICTAIIVEKVIEEVDVAPYPVAIPKVTEKEAEAEKDIADTRKPQTPAIFTPNPNDFHPIGLVKTVYPGTKNGMIITWSDPVTNVTIFEWDEDYKYGPHYHALLPSQNSKHDQTHYQPGSPVPEPWRSTYFGG